MHTSYQYKAYINFKFHHFPSLKPTFNTPLSWSSCQTGFGFWDSTPQPCAPAALHSPPGRLVSPASQRHCADAAAGRLEPRVPRLVGGRGCLGLPQPDQPTNPLRMVGCSMQPVNKQPKSDWNWPELIFVFSWKAEKFQRVFKRKRENKILLVATQVSNMGWWTNSCGSAVLPRTAWCFEDGDWSKSINSDALRLKNPGMSLGSSKVSQLCPP